MVSSDGPPAGWNTGSGIDVRAEALDVLSDVRQWRLADARWRAVEQVLIAMDAAVQADDSDALMAATADLELAGPLRLTRIGATPVGPPARPVRDRLNRLVHSLGGTVPEQQREPEDPGADDAGASRH